jgi:hypothetical protein
MVRWRSFNAFALVCTWLLAAMPEVASAQRLLKGYEFSSPPETMDRLLEGVIVVPLGGSNRTLEVALLRDGNKLYFYDEQGGCLSRLNAEPGLPANEYLFVPVQNDVCGTRAPGEWLIRYFRLAILPCETSSCTQRTFTLKAKRSWPGTVDTKATLAVLVDGALDPTDQKASGRQNVRRSSDPNEMLLAPYKVLYSGEVTDIRGQTHPLRVYEITFGNAKKPSLLLYEPASGCLTPISSPLGYRYNTPVWYSATDLGGAMVETQCDHTRRLNTWESMEAMQLDVSRNFIMAGFIGSILWAEQKDGRYDVVIQKYSEFASGTWDKGNSLATGTLTAVTGPSIFPEPPEPPKEVHRMPLMDYAPVPGLVFKSRDYWKNYTSAGTLARVFNGDFEGLTNYEPFHTYLAAYVEEFYTNCKAYLPADRITRLLKRWDEDQFGRVENYREYYVEFDPRFDGVFQRSESYSEGARTLELMGEVFDGMMIGGQRGIDSIRNSIMGSATDTISLYDNMGSLLQKAGCNSATRRQLEENFLRAAQGMPSLQADGEVLAGAAAESDKPGAITVVPVKRATSAPSPAPTVESRSQPAPGEAPPTPPPPPPTPATVAPRPTPASQPQAEPAPSAQEMRQQEAAARQAKMESLTELSLKFQQQQQAAMQRYQADIPNATTPEEKTAIQRAFREEVKRLQVELQEKIDEINAR